MTEYSVTKDGKFTLYEASTRAEAKALAQAAFDAGADAVAVHQDECCIALFLDHHCAPKWSQWFSPSSRG